MKKSNRTYLAGFLSLVLVLSALTGPMESLAAEGRVGGGEAAEILLKNRQEAVVQRQPSAEKTADFPEKFDLRERGVVTPVKLQNPFGTCWGFAAIAAAETSILSKTGQTYEETGLDLSEHHLTYFARTAMNDGGSQDGEGIYMYDENNRLNTGGMMFTATSLFSTGMGVVEEELIPYRGKNSKTDSFFGINFSYSAADDWSIPDEYKFVQSYELENSDILQSPAVYRADLDWEEAASYAETNAAYLGYDQAATDRMKQALMDGYAISIAFAADSYLPSQLGTGAEPEYINTDDNKWTHYTYDSAPVTHAVTIVGWDDTIPSTDFLDHTDDPHGDGLAHQPEGDGAWIVKNSWGAATEDFPNNMRWGVENEDGKATGYFYLSYYDRSISSPEIFDFKVVDDQKPGYIIDQYDYLQSGGTHGWIDANEVKSANIFRAEYDSVLRALSCETSMANTEVSYDVYLLSEAAETPTDGEKLLSASGRYELPGYHRLTLGETAELKKGQRYAVVMTQKTEYDGTPYYTFSTTTALNEEGTEAANRTVKANHENSFLEYYAKGVVNPGESFIYVGELDAWSDFSEIIPALQETEEYRYHDFDNFPIKAYLDFVNEADYANVNGAPKETIFAAPAGKVNGPQLAMWIALALAALSIPVWFVVLIVLNHKKKKKLRALQAELAALKAEKTSEAAAK